MSVRRLAEEKVQPKSFAFNRKFAAESKVWIKKYPKGREQSAVIPLLMLAQEQEGWVSKPAIEHVAGMLDMAYIRVLEVATFYTQFQLGPVGTKAHIQVCGTTPCMLRGSEALMDVCRSKIHHDQFHLNDKGTLSWEEVECLGACVNAPMIMVFKDTYEDLTPERLAAMIDEFETGKDVKTGPQIKRVFSAPATGYTTLQDKKAISKAERQRLAKEFAKESAAKAASAVVAAPPAAAAPAKPAEPAKPAPAKKAAAQKKVATPAALVSTPKPKAEPKPAAAPKAAAEAAPELLKKPRSGKGDDLKLIWGVGPKLEKMLNAMGVWHFDQVASWGKAELSWVDSRLEGFKGRASRDEWVKQAKKLAKGWRPEKGVGDEPV
ncbi:MAG: NADH-quinone oxidoreductase subunit NuoE [Rhizobiaceae bacterium]